jgi:hypothetical protein
VQHVKKWFREVENVRKEVNDDSSTSRLGALRMDVNAGLRERLV